MDTFFDELTQRVSETTAALIEQQQPTSVTHTEAEAATGNFSLLTGITKSATALTGKVAQSLVVAKTLTAEGVQQVGEQLSQVTMEDIAQQLPTPVVEVMGAAAASSNTLQTLTRVAGSVSATTQQAVGIASRVQPLTVEGVPQVYNHLQRGDIGAALQCGEKVLSELATELNAAAALAADATKMVEDLANLQEDVKADLCQVTGAVGEKIGGKSGRVVAEFVTRAALPSFNILDSIKKHS